MKLSKNKIKFGIGLFLFCCAYWVLDSIWSYLSFEKNLSSMIFREPMSYWDTLLLDVPPYQVVSRIMVVVIFIVSGILISLFFYKHRQNERTIREQRDFLTTLVETIPNPVYYKNTDGIYSGCNSAFEAFFGRRREDIIGKSDYDIVEREMADKAQQMDRELVTSAGVQHHECKLKRFDGEFRDVVLDNATLINNAGEVIGLIGVFSDITKRKQAEKEKMRLQRQLQQSQKMEAIGTLAGGIAHDFNNILYGTIGFTELCIDDAEPGTILHENLKEILAGGKRAKALVEQILTFSRHTENEMGPIQISSIVQEVSKLLRATIPTTIEITVDIRCDSSTVMGDPTQIHQVIINLCTNAHHAMENKGGRLRIQLENIALEKDAKILETDKIAPGDFLKMSVSDTGTGIPPEIRDRIFDPFFTSKEQGKGTGMGLAVVHGIVQSHGGLIDVASVLGEGTTFDIYWPLIEENAEALERIDTEDLPGGHEHILLVDDEVQVVVMQRQMLERLNYTVTTRTSSLEAIEAIHADHVKYDAVITDMIMPCVTGDCLTVEVKKIRPGMPVILCTGNPEKIADIDLEEIGIDALLLKPFSKADLARTLRQVLDR